MLFYKIEAEMLVMKEIKDNRVQENYAMGLRPKFDMFYQKHDKNIYMFVACIKNHKITVGALASSAYTFKIAMDSFFELIEIKCQDIDIEEITLNSMESLLRLSDRNSYINDDNEVLEYFDLNEITGRLGRNIRFTENLITDIPSKRDLIKKSDKLLCGETLTPEIERIYKGTLRVVKFGHPVHYLIQTDDADVRDQMVKILITALYDNGRIHSKRFCGINFESNDNSPSRSYEYLYKSCYGGAIVAQYSTGDERDSEHARVGMDVISRLCNMMRKYKNDVLTIFCLPRSCEKVKSAFMEHLGAATIVVLNEETVFGDKAKKYLKQIAKNYGATPDKSLYKNVQDTEKGYLADDLNKEFDLWFSCRLKTYIYSQYADLEAANRFFRRNADTY